MKTQLLNVLTTITLLLIPIINFAQTPTLGTAASFVLYSSDGAVTNTGTSHITGNVGTNAGSSTGFGNVNGVMHDQDDTSLKCATDLLNTYNQLNSDTIEFIFPSDTIGKGDTILAGVDSIPLGAAILKGNLFLNAKGNANAVFIIKIQGAFSTDTSSKIILINGALACNVFWKVEGAVSMAAQTTMRGTVIAHNAAISMGVDDTLEGRVLSTTGAVSVNGILAYTPIGCGSPILTGPTAPVLAATTCYALFSTDGNVMNTGISNITGDVGTNVGSTTGFGSSVVIGTIHAIPDASTDTCATYLAKVYTYLSTLSPDIELLYPAQFGNNLVLTPHTYVMNATTTFTDTLFLNAEDDSNAVFVIQINGALSTSTHSNVILINEAKAKNVYWLVNGAVSIADTSVFNGTLVCNNGAILLNQGVTLNGRVLTTTGALTTEAITVDAIGSQPLISIISASGSTTFCSGKSIILSGNNGGTWNIGKATATITVDTAGDYYVINTSSCGGSDTSNHILVIVNPLPTVSVTTPAAVCDGDTVSLTASGTTSYTWSPAKGLSATTDSSVIANPTVTTTYTVTGTDSLGCSAAKTVTVTINPTPIITIIPSPASICIGGSSTITLSGASTYTWSPSKSLSDTTGETATANPTVTATYTIVGTSSKGCVDTTTETVIVNALPGKPKITKMNADVLTSSNDTLNNQWYLNGSIILGADNPTYIADEKGCYSVGVTNPATSCSSLSDTTCVSTVISGIKRLSINSNQLSIYPNPTSGQFTVKSDDNQNGYAVEVYNVVGEKVFQSVLSNSQITIDLSSKSAGLYFVYLKSEESVEVGKVLITK
jgi:hypothetical protein